MGLFLTSINISAIYRPIKPKNKIVRPPNKNIEDKIETQPCGVVSKINLFIIRYKIKKNELIVIKKPT